MGWVVELPRIARIVLTGLIALAVTLLITPLVDGIYLANYYNPDTVLVPALISTGIGIIIYVIGWRLLIGYSGERPRYTRALVIYLLFGLFVIVFSVALFVFGMTKH